MLSAVILSGGKGSRMGRDKGLVRLGHAPLVRYVAEVLSSIADEVLVSVAKGRRAAYAELLDKEYAFVEDREEGIGPVHGLIQGLEAAKGEYVLVSPCDTPFLRRNVCEAIVATAKGRDGAVPKTGARYFEPLHGAYRRTACVEAFRRVLASGKRTPTYAYKDLDIAFIDEPALRAIDPDLMSFWNINSPRDLEMAEAQLGRLR